MTSSTKESAVQTSVMLYVGQLPFVRIWRQNVGVAVPQSIVHAARTKLQQGDIEGARRLLTRPRIVAFGLKGSADISGAFACGKRVEIECKRPGGKASEDQKKFGIVMQKLRVFYVIVESVEDAKLAIDTHLESCRVCRSRTEWT